MSNEKQTELHNRIAGPIVASIVKPVMDAGGSYTDVLVVLESVVVGVMLVVVKLGGDNIVLDVFFEAIRARLAKDRLEPITPRGRG